MLCDEPANGAMKIVSLRDVHRDRVRCSDQPLYRSMIFLWENLLGYARVERESPPHGRGRRITGGVTTCKERGAQEITEEEMRRAFRRTEARLQ